jgi:hypothetical protein
VVVAGLISHPRPARRRLAARRAWRAALALAGLSAARSLATAGGQVWIVDELLGPGTNYGHLQPAMDAAADGDVLLVRSGDYEPFTLVGKSLAVFADVGHQVNVLVEPDTIPGELALAPDGSQIRDLPQGGWFTVRGIAFRVADPTYLAINLWLRDCAGRTWIEDCSLFKGRPSLQADDALSVTLVRSVLSGAGGGQIAPCLGSFGAGGALFANSSPLWCYSTVALGGGGASALNCLEPGLAAKPGETGIENHESSVLLVGSAVVGGSGGAGGTMASGECLAPADGAAALWLSGGAAQAWLVDTGLAGGTGGVAEGACPGATSPGTALEAEPGAAVEWQADAPVLSATAVAREGELVVLAVTAEVGSNVFALFSEQQAGALEPDLSGALLIGESMGIAPLGTVDRTGILTYAHVVHELGPGVEGAVVYIQPLAYSPATGRCTLGAPSASLLLDQGL